MAFPMDSDLSRVRIFTYKSDLYINSFRMGSYLSRWQSPVPSCWGKSETGVRTPGSLPGMSLQNAVPGLKRDGSARGDISNFSKEQEVRIESGLFCMSNSTDKNQKIVWNCFNQNQKDKHKPKTVAGSMDSGRRSNPSKRWWTASLMMKKEMNWVRRVAENTASTSTRQ